MNSSLVSPIILLPVPVALTVPSIAALIVAYSVTPSVIAGNPTGLTTIKTFVEVLGTLNGFPPVPLDCPGIASVPRVKVLSTVTLFAASKNIARTAFTSDSLGNPLSISLGCNALVLCEVVWIFNETHDSPLGFSVPPPSSSGRFSLHDANIKPASAHIKKYFFFISLKFNY